MFLKFYVLGERVIETIVTMGCQQVVVEFDY